MQAKIQDEKHKAEKNWRVAGELDETQAEIKYSPDECKTGRWRQLLCRGYYKALTVLVTAQLMGHGGKQSLLVTLTSNNALENDNREQTRFDCWSATYLISAWDAAAGRRGAAFEHHSSQSRASFRWNNNTCCLRITPTPKNRLGVFPVGKVLQANK